MTDAYEIEMERGKGMDLNATGLPIRPTVRAVIKRKATGKIVWSTASWFEPGPRNLGAQAGKMRKRYEYHLKKNGEGFEEQQERERLAKQVAERNKYLRRHYLAAASEDMLNLLQQSALHSATLVQKIEASLAKIEANTDPKAKDIPYE